MSYMPAGCPARNFPASTAPLANTLLEYAVCLNSITSSVPAKITSCSPTIVRHIRRADVYDLRPLLRTEFNIEGYPSPEFIDLVLKVKPHQVTLVPDDPSQITSNSGWDTKANLEFLSEVLDQFNSAGIRTSVFVAADPEMVEYAAKAGADRVELYTEPR